jgi:hypothetical protein
MGHKSLLLDRRMIYNPQGIIESGMKKVKECSHRGNIMGGDGISSSRPNQVGKEYMSYTNFPNDFLEYGNIKLLHKKELFNINLSIKDLEWLVVLILNINHHYLLEHLR